MSSPLVVKLGGDALATPQRIASAARLITQRLKSTPVVAVASARRGVTDHLLALVEQVKHNATTEGSDFPAVAAASDRAVGAGEVVAASLLAVALLQLGVKAEVLDAREAGVRTDGEWGRAQLTGVRPASITRLLQRGVTPVVTGFQGWHRGRFTTLGRGGSDTTAIALANALGALRCELVKPVAGVFTADPRLVPQARLIPRVSHPFLVELAAAGAKVISLRGAILAGRSGMPLRFSSMEDQTLHTDVTGDHPDGAIAIASRSGRYRLTSHLPVRIDPGTVTAFRSAVREGGIPAELELTEDRHGFRLELLVDAGDMEACLSRARRVLPRGRGLSLLATGLTTVSAVGAQAGLLALLTRTAQHSGATVLGRSVSEDRVSFLVPDRAGEELVRTLHASLNSLPSSHFRPSEPDNTQIPIPTWRSYVSQR